MKNVLGKILVVDDEPEIGWLLSRILGEDGYQVRTAKTGKEALAKIEKEQPDLIFLDVKLPGQDGMAVLQKIKESKSKQLVIMLTAHEDVRTAVEAMKLGAYDYLIKPLPNDRLKIIVRHALQTVELEPPNQWPEARNLQTLDPGPVDRGKPADASSFSVGAEGGHA